MTKFKLANAVISELHDRMPVILGGADRPKWLGEEPAELPDLLKLCPGDWLKIWPVDRRSATSRTAAPSWRSRSGGTRPG